MNNSEANETRKDEQISEEKHSVVNNNLNGQEGEEKIKKRVCHSPIDENPKRTKSDNVECGNSLNIMTGISDCIVCVLGQFSNNC